MNTPKWPAPDATFAEVQAFLRANAPPPEPPHEAPEVENGPSLMCNACGIVRVGMYTPFCKGCLAQIESQT